MKRKFSMKSIMVVLLFSVMIVGNVTSVHAATSISTLKQQYPSNSKWNSSYKNKAWQCHGFACMLADKLTDTDPYTWSRVNHFNSLKAGDIIRFTRPHSILVTNVSGDTVTYVDCNWVAANTVRWDQTIQKSQLTSKFGNLSAVWVSPKNIGSGGTVSAGNSTAPTISSVRINHINKDNVNFSFSVKNGTFVKILIESTLTGAKKEITCTSNLSNINYTFSRSSIPTGGNQYRIYLYAYNGSRGNYKNERIHKMRYGSTPDCVTFPGTLSNSQMKSLVFNSRLYADMYSDLKRAYGYDDNRLWKHYLLNGIRENRVTATFDPSYYLKNSSDVGKAYGARNYEKAFYHFTTYGYAENRTSSPVFTASYYLAKNSDIARAYGRTNYYQAAVHFNRNGIYELRNSSLYYWGSWYKIYNADLRRLNMSSYNLIKHYLCYGIYEKRFANSGKKIPVR